MKKRFLPFSVLIFITSLSIAQTHTLKVTVPDTVMVCYVAGTFNSWNPSANEMTKISDSPKMFSFEFGMANEELNTVEYKFLSGPDWKYQQKDTANFKFLEDSATAVVDTFMAIYNTSTIKDVTIDVLVPAEVYQCYLTGTFNSWNPTANPMEFVDSTVNGKEFKLTILTDTTTLEYKFIAGPGWPYEQVAGNYIYMTDGGTVVCDEFKMIFDPSKVGDITINIISVPEGTPAVYIIGSFGQGWKLEEAILATDNGDGSYTAIIPDVADIEYKCWNYPEWAYEEAADDQGTSVPNRKASFETGPVFEIQVEYWKAVHEGPSGINDPSVDAYKIYTINGTVIVEGVNTAVSVFDLTGRMIQQAHVKGTFESQNLQPGIYILRVDNQTQKVSIR
jgi:hypothetical protein